MSRPTYPIQMNGDRHIAEHNWLAENFPSGSIIPTGAANELLAYIPDSGKFVVPPGTWNMTQTITLNSDQWIEAADHTSAISYTGTGTALRLEAPPSYARHRLPAVRKVGPYWYADGGERTSIGVQWVNGNHGVVEVGAISGFYVGLDVRGEAAGSSYNRFLLGHLLDNMIGLRMSGGWPGYSNANHYVGGSIKLSSSTVSGVVGSRYIAGTATGGTGDSPGGNVGNGNVFDGIALEGDYPELSVEITSGFNTFVGCRFESASPIRFTGPIAYGNVIVGGYGVFDDQGVYGVQVQGNTDNTIFSGMERTGFAPWAAIPA